jgi:demethylmenaquinone methyltransferase/2-methoxy-6-polyprenyl-1,4-benzoquinol methylase
VTDEVLADQVDYYRRRAGEYDVTAYGDVAAARARIARLVAEMRPAGSVLEIACGTGLWTEALAGWADTVTAIDAAPEAVAIARDRVRLASVSFEVADVFSWDPGTRFDVIFFSAWLSHVPASRFGQFWQLLGDGWPGTDGCCSSTSTSVNAGKRPMWRTGMRSPNGGCAMAARSA